MRSTEIITDAPVQQTSFALGAWSRRASNFRSTETGTQFTLALGDPRHDYPTIEAVQVLLAVEGIRSR